MSAVEVGLGRAREGAPYSVWLWADGHEAAILLTADDARALAAELVETARGADSLTAAETASAWRR